MVEADICNYYNLKLLLFYTQLELPWEAFNSKLSNLYGLKVAEREYSKGTPVERRCAYVGFIVYTTHQDQSGLHLSHCSRWWTLLILRVKSQGLRM